MAQQTINVGAAPNDGTGTPLRTAFQYTNSNFSELYTAVGPSGNNIVVPGNATITGDLTVDTSTLKVDSANNYVSVGTVSGFNLAAGRGNLTVGGSSSAIINLSTASADSGNLFHDGTEMFLLNRTASGALSFQTNVTTRYSISSTGVSTWSVAGTTAMTLNSTGLGVGASPVEKLTVAGRGLFVSANPDNAALKLEASAGTNSVAINFVNTGGNYFVGVDNSVGGRLYGVPYSLCIGSTGAYPVVIATNNTARLTVDSSGNVGIGVTPSVQIGNYKSLQIGIGGNLIGRTDNAGIELSSNAYRSGSGSYIYLNTDNSASYRQYSGAHEWYTAPSGSAGNAITFTQAMTLDASGNLLVGTTTMPSGVTLARLVAKSDLSDWSGVIWNSNAIPYGFRIQHDTDSNGTGNEFLYCLGAANLRASIRSNGGIANYQANDVSLSDSRMKSDIKPLGSYWNKIKSLEIVTFKYKDQTHNDDNIGLIAQQVESVAPEFVDVDGFGNTPDDGVPLKTIYTTDLYHAAIKALQEAMTRIEVLESKLA